MSSLEKRLHLNKLPPMPPSGIGGGLSKRPMMRKKDYSPVTWDKYFDNKEDVKVSEREIFRLYSCGDAGPVLFFLHGGGFSALSWALLSSVLSGLIRCRCAAVDLRGHGDTRTADDKDLSIGTLSSDVGNIIKAKYGEDPPPIMLIGHSMGGAIAIHTAEKQLIPSLIGLSVIDVVEGTALDALNSMQSFLRSRPSLFNSLEHAIEWSVRSGQIRNLESARVSMGGQVTRVNPGEDVSSLNMETTVHSTPTNNTISEEEEEEGESSKSNSGNTENKNTGATASNEKFTWRINLSKTEKYWEGWFSKLSSLFLSCEVPKMLLLAGVDRLDKELTIGQMQGKFQMQVLPQCGHAVHEDVPEKVADVIAAFITRHKFAEATDKFHKTFPAC
ncbi:protein phosphatase methylesterase 1-like [Lineus longissimus]|uniref:protein phosphatase methylesterase 1-like n=1 Tax=Lineus longissimus TaxID=88925 RepID=UPI00315CF127